MSEQTIPIPGRLKNVAIGGHVAGSEDIDAGGGKTQKQVNDETNDTLALHQSEISGLNSQNYVSVNSYSSLPATGEVDTIYRVSSYDGTQVDATKYAEYTWNGSAYVLLDVKTQVGEVFDISQYKAVGGTLAKFADLSAALDNGNNVPAGIRKGGMSIKYVQSSDNKYVQYRCKAQTFSDNPEDWEMQGGMEKIELYLAKEYNVQEIVDNHYQHIGTGEEESANGFFIAKGFLVKGYKKLSISHTVASIDTAVGIVFYTENGSMVSGSGVTLNEDKNISIPENAYSANISFNKTIYNSMSRFVFHLYTDTDSIVSNLSQQISAVNNKADSNKTAIDKISFNNSSNTTNLIPLSEAETTNNKGLNDNGEMVNITWSKMSSRFFEVIPNSQVQYKLRAMSGLAIAFYTAADESTYIDDSGVPYGSGNIEGIVNVPSNAHYMRFCSTEWTNGYYVYINTIATVNFTNSINGRDISLSHANIVDDYYIDKNVGINSSEYFGYYELPVTPGETIILYSGVISSDASNVLGYYLDNELISYEEINSYSKQKCSFVVPNGVNNVKVSFRKTEKPNLYFMHDYSSLLKSYGTRISNIENALPSTTYNVGLSINANQAITQGNAAFCNITKSDGIKVSGTGTTTITLALAEALQNGTIISLGIKIPYDTQKVATISIDGGNAIGTPGTTQKTKSGLMFKMQGESYQRVNIRYHAQTIAIVITTTETTDDWELWISDSVIVNDNMPLAPVCYIYDGGHWDGHVMYNNENISIWTLHRRLGIPYTIAMTQNEYTTEPCQQEVLDDIASGFAEVITRIGSPYTFVNTDANVIDSIVTSINNCLDGSVGADCMGAVFATHAYDKDTIRCVKKSGIDWVRTYPTYDGVEKYGSKFGDYDLLMISGHSVSSNSLIPTDFMGFPVILWAHGVGDPQSAVEQEKASFYEDKTNGSYQAGTNTIAAMTKILNAQASGNAAAMKASDFIAFCKKYQ